MVVLPPESWYSRQETQNAFDAALECIRNNGSKPRYRSNRLIFLAADQGTLSRLRDTARVVLAWASIVDDIEEGRLNVDLLQKKQAENELKTAEDVLPRAARECYRWLLCPVQETPTEPRPSLEAFPLNTTGGSVSSGIERACIDNELVITTWSPIHLRTKLAELYWKDGQVSIKAMAFWEDTLRYLYLPRLKNRDVLAHAIQAGAKSRDFFGIAYGQSGEKFDGFQFGKAGIQFDDTLLLIKPEAAQAYEESQRRPGEPPVTKPTVGGDDHKSPVTLDDSGAPTAPQMKMRSFHGVAEVPSATAKIRLVQLADEIVSLLSSDPNASVRISVEIAAQFPDGATEQVKRAVSENANSLGLKSAEWE